MATNQGQGFQNMSEEKHRQISQKGGEGSSSKQDMSELGKKGAAAQSTEAKAKGGKNSHKND